MVLIIRQLTLKENWRPAKYDDFPKSSLNYETETEDLELYRYEPKSYPLSKRKIVQTRKYRGSIENAPIEVFKSTDSGAVKDQKFIAKQLYEEYGPGRFNVFIFGGNPPRESVFENTVIREKLENKKEDVKAKA